MCCRARGSPDAGTVIAIDRAKGRQKLVARVRRHRTTGRAGRRCRRSVKQATAGRGADYVFEAAGQRRRFRLGGGDRAAGRPGGVAGQGQRQPGGRLPLGRADGREAIVRSSYGDARPQARFPVARARSTSTGRLKLDELITAPHPLQRDQRGFRAMRARRGHPHRGTAVGMIFLFLRGEAGEVPRRGGGSWPRFGAAHRPLRREPRHLPAQLRAGRNMIAK